MTGKPKAASRGRVFLRPPRLRDEGEFLGLVRRSARLYRGWVSPPDTPERFRALVAAARRRDTRSYLICLADGEAIAGYATLSQICGGNFRSTYLGFAGSAPYTGAGYMTEGVGLVLREAFTTLGLHRVEANIQPENARSLALAQRAGFRPEGYSPRYLRIGGRWRDHERWSLLREQWRHPRKARQDVPGDLFSRYVHLHNQGVAAGDYRPLLTLFRPDARMVFLGTRFGPLEGRAAIAAAFRDHPPDDRLVLAGRPSVRGDVAECGYSWAARPSRPAGRLRLRAAEGRIAELTVVARGRRADDVTAAG